VANEEEEGGHGEGEAEAFGDDMVDAGLLAFDDEESVDEGPKRLPEKVHAPNQPHFELARAKQVEVCDQIPHRRRTLGPHLPVSHLRSRTGEVSCWGRADFLEGALFFFYLGDLASAYLVEHLGAELCGPVRVGAVERGRLHLEEDDVRQKETPAYVGHAHHH